MSTLAIDGGKRVFPEGFAFNRWPPVYPETAEKIKELYLSANWSYNGPYEKQFSKEFANYHDAEYGVCMVNGTVTLECALAALGVGPGDEVIVPSWTWLATGTAVVFLGATPVFVDGEADTFCLDPAAFEAAITPRTKAVVPVHLFGSMADMDRIVEIARKHDIKIVEDCAHAHGGKWNGKGVGSLGDVGSFSFQQSKIMTSGEGGICITNNEKFRELCYRRKHIGNPGFPYRVTPTPSPIDFLCHNYRGTEFQALILEDQLAHLKEDTKLRMDNVAYLRAGLEQIPGIGTQKPGRCATEQSYYVFGITVEPEVLKEGKTKADVIKALNAEGAVELFAGWGATTYKQTLWNISEKHYRVESFEVVENIIKNKIILLDIRWLMDRKNIDMLLEAFRKVMKEYSK